MLMTNRETYEQLEHITRCFESVDVSYSYIDNGFFTTMEYVKAANCMYTMLVDYTIVKNNGITENNLYNHSKIMDAALKCKTITKTDDALIRVSSSVFEIADYDIDNVAAKLSSLFSRRSFKVMCYVRAVLYDIRFNAIWLYCIMCLISIVIVGLTVYSVAYRRNNRTMEFLDDVEELDDEDELEE